MKPHENEYLTLLELFDKGRLDEAVRRYRTLDDGTKFMWARILWSHHGDRGINIFDRALFNAMHPVSPEAQAWLDAAKVATE